MPMLLISIEFRTMRSSTTFLLTFTQCIPIFGDFPRIAVEVDVLRFSQPDCTADQSSFAAKISVDVQLQAFVERVSEHFTGSHVSL